MNQTKVGCILSVEIFYLKRKFLLILHQKSEEKNMANGSHRSHISDAELGKQLLKKQLADLNKNPVEGFSAGLINDSDFFKWEVSRRFWT